MYSRDLEDFKVLLYGCTVVYIVYTFFPFLVIHIYTLGKIINNNAIDIWFVPFHIRGNTLKSIYFIFQHQKQNVTDLQTAIKLAKSKYAKSLRKLEDISLAIHEARRNKLLLLYPRQPGVGAESDSLCSSLSEVTLGKLFSITVIANQLLKWKGTTLSVSSWESFSKWHKLAKILKTCILNLLLIFKWWLMSSILFSIVNIIGLHNDNVCVT